MKPTVSERRTETCVLRVGPRTRMVGSSVEKHCAMTHHMAVRHEQRDSPRSDPTAPTVAYSNRLGRVSCCARIRRTIFDIACLT